MILFDKQLNVFHLSNDQISYLIQIEEGGNVAHLYFGKKSLIILAAVVIHVLIGPFAQSPRQQRPAFLIRHLDDGISWQRLRRFSRSSL